MAESSGELIRAEDEPRSDSEQAERYLEALGRQLRYLPAASPFFQAKFDGIAPGDLRDIGDLKLLELVSRGSIEQPGAPKAALTERVAA